MAGAGPEYCDLVMKGGITSGIVYPNAVLALAKRYRFKNIGGTSAGAIAAAATAAAALGERRRRHDDQAAIGFAALEGVAAQLKERGFIFGLFQPVFGSRAAFRMIITLAARPGMGLLKLCSTRRSARLWEFTFVRQEEAAMSLDDEIIDTPDGPMTWAQWKKKNPVQIPSRRTKGKDLPVKVKRFTTSEHQVSSV